MTLVFAVFPPERRRRRHRRFPGRLLRTAGAGLLAAGLSGVVAAPPGAAALRTPSATRGLSRADSRRVSPGVSRAAGDRAALAAALDEVVKAGAPGALAVVEDGAGPWRGARGVADLATGAPMSPDDDFRAGSVTKAFVATVVLQLVQEGRVRLDAPVTRYVPGLLPANKGVTVRQLLNMTGGVPDYIDDLPGDTPREFRANRQRTFTPAQLLALADRHGARFRPGAAWAYSNSDYIALGLLVERVSGHDLGAELRARIIAPLHLRHTVFPTTSPLIPWPHAHGYHPTGDPKAPYFDTTAPNPSVWWATGALVTDGADLDRFFGALLSGRLVAPGLLAQMKTTITTGWSLVPAYGLGLVRRELSCGRPVWGHSGIVEGYTTYAFVSADGRDQIAISANTSSNSAVTAAMTAMLETEFCGVAPRRPAARTPDFARYHL